jgi:hypothetical protein
VRADIEPHQDFQYLKEQLIRLLLAEEVQAVLYQMLPHLTAEIVFFLQSHLSVEEAAATMVLLLHLPQHQAVLAEEADVQKMVLHHQAVLVQRHRVMPVAQVEIAKDPVKQDMYRAVAAVRVLLEEIHHPQEQVDLEVTVWHLLFQVLQ